MIKVPGKKILNDQRIRDEIDKHKWIESEKAGYDIGFDKAAEDWINRYAEDWEQHSTPKATKKIKSFFKKKSGRKNSDHASW